MVDNRNISDSPDACTSSVGVVTEGGAVLTGKTAKGLESTLGIVVFEAATKEAARQFLDEDPAVKGGIMSATLHSYAVALQRKL